MSSGAGGWSFGAGAGLLTIASRALRLASCGDASGAPADCARSGTENWSAAQEALRDAVFGLVISQNDNLHARLEQRRDDVALQEVDDRHAVVGGDEDLFGHIRYE